MVWWTPLVVVPRASLPPAVAIHVVRLACERPETLNQGVSRPQAVRPSVYH